MRGYVSGGSLESQKASYLPNKHSSSPDPSKLEDLIILIKDVYMSKIYIPKKKRYSTILLLYSTACN